VHGTQGHPIMGFLNEFNLSVSKIKKWGGIEVYDPKLSNTHIDFKLADFIQTRQFHYLQKVIQN